MKKKEVRQYEMLVRVRDFGTAQAALFPEATLADEAFATIDDAVKQLSKYTGSKVMSTRGSARTKAKARAALFETLRAFRRTARGIAAEEPAFQNKFQIPRRHPGPVLVTLGRSFAQQAEPNAALFIERGMPETFLADLNAHTDAYEQAIRRRAVSREESSEAQARIQAALDAGMAAVQQLDLVVTNHLRDDPGMVARWMQSRHVEYPKYPRRPATSDESVAAPAPTTPTAATPAISPSPPADSEPVEVPDDEAA